MGEPHSLLALCVSAGRQAFDHDWYRGRARQKINFRTTENKLAAVIHHRVRTHKELPFIHHRVRTHKELPFIHHRVEAHNVSIYSSKDEDAYGVAFIR